MAHTILGPGLALSSNVRVVRLVRMEPLVILVRRVLPARIKTLTVKLGATRVRAGSSSLGTARLGVPSAALEPTPPLLLRMRVLRALLARFRLWGELPAATCVRMGRSVLRMGLLLALHAIMASGL
jgi:hypothetical protein